MKHRICDRLDLGQALLCDVRQAKNERADEDNGRGPKAEEGQYKTTG